MTTVSILPEQAGTPDRFFTKAQQQRLEVLMADWRTARDNGTTLPLEKQKELNELVETELQASAQRADTLH